MSISTLDNTQILYYSTKILVKNNGVTKHKLPEWYTDPEIITVSVKVIEDGFYKDATHITTYSLKREDNNTYLYLFSKVNKDTEFQVTVKY